MKNMISIILPAYNREAYIEECIGSVQAQSYRNFEIVIIDDGSTDNTLGICRRLAQTDDRIKLLTGTHSGVSAARNVGLDAAEGDFVFFLDSDDVIHPLLLETLVTGMLESGAQMGGTGVVSVGEKYWHKVRERLQQQPVAAGTAYKTHEETMRALFYGKSPFGMIGGTMMRRDHIGETRFRTDLFIGEDYYFVYENLIKGASTVFLEDKKWYYGRNHANNSSWNWDFEGFWTRFYRRQLVWESEEALGRKEYADIQKRDAFGSFVTCFQRCDPKSEDSRKMRNTLREYRNTLFPALTVQGKVFYLLAIYAPPAYRGIHKLFQKMKKLLKKLKKSK